MHRSRCKQALVSLAILFCLPFWAIWPVSLLERQVYRLDIHLPILEWLLGVPSFLAALLLSELTRYIILSLMAITLTFIAVSVLLIWERGRIWRSAAFYTCMIGLATVIVFPAASGTYRPAVSVRPGIESYHVTRPGRLKNVIRNLQSEAEVRSETYELLGWADARTLIYRARHSSGNTCPAVLDSGTVAVAAAYDIDSGISRVWEGKTDALYRESCLQSRCILPSLTSSQDGRAYLPGCDHHSLLSPDGNWVAFVVAHLYGPEDVMILANAEQDASDQDAVSSLDMQCVETQCNQISEMMQPLWNERLTVRKARCADVQVLVAASGALSMGED